MCVYGACVAEVRFLRCGDLDEKFVSVEQHGVGRSVVWSSDGIWFVSTRDATNVVSGKTSLRVEVKIITGDKGTAWGLESYAEPVGSRRRRK